ncbi:MAG: helix-turn-helix domain-containing protein [bacterium]
MKRTSKASKAEKLKAVNAYLDGKKTQHELGEELQCGKSTIQRWVSLYRDQGKDGLDVREKNHSYSKEIKQAAVEAYVMEGMSLNEVSGKFGLSTHSVLGRWIKKYNSHIELKDYDPKGDVYMTKTRPTTQEERLSIVQHCLAHEKRYTLTAAKYAVPYSRVYMWVRKYQTEGEDGLLDRRGRHKTASELTDFEKLERENKLLKQRNDDLKMENELLKKVEEIERRRRSAARGKNRAI